MKSAVAPPTREPSFPVMPDGRGLADGAPGHAIAELAWAHHVPSVRTPGPGCLVILRLRAGDVTAYGYAHVWHPDPAPVAAALGAAVSGGLAGSAPRDWAQCRARLEREHFRLLGARGLPGVVLGALDIGMWDLHCKQLGVPIQQLLGADGPADAYSGDGLYPKASAGECRAAAERLVQQGFEAVKLWTSGQDVVAERSRMEAVRAAVGPDRRIAIDAGAQYDRDSAPAILQLAADMGVDWVEDPIARDDLEGWAALARRSPVALAGGQESSVAGLATLLDAVPLHTALIDLQQVGGISGWLEAVAVCASRGVRPSAHAYTHVGVRLLAGCRAADAIVQHAPWDDDVFGPVARDAGRAVPPAAPGAAADPRVELDWTSTS